MNVYLPNLRLPSTYQEVDYIESSGTQWIDIGIKLNYQTSVDMYISFTSLGSGWTGIIGAQTYNNNHSFAIGINGNGTATYQNRKESGYMFVDFSFSPTLNQKYGISAGGRYIYIDGELKGTMQAEPVNYETEYNARIFSVYQNSNGGFPYNVSARLYFCKIYNNGVLVRNFIPCYRKSDSVIGLYDLVNNQFYTNSGTGTFSKGNDVTMSELKNAYIGEYVWAPDASRTLLYMPMESNLTDMSGNGRTASGSNISFTTLGGISCASGNGSNSKVSITPLGFCDSNNDTYGTVSVLLYLRSIATSGNYTKALEFTVQNKNGFQLARGEINGGTNQWLHIVRVGNKNDGTEKYYINGVLKATYTTSNEPRGKWANSYEQGQYLFCNRGGNNNRMNGGMRELIMENVLWDENYINKYYQRIKAKLGF